jgi:hypothetical protein
MPGLPLCDEFNNDDKVFAFLISTLAGGVGLNLTGASPCHMARSAQPSQPPIKSSSLVRSSMADRVDVTQRLTDPNWNPSHDAQAQDRAYRWYISRRSFNERSLI